MTKIPKILHYCWFGGNEYSPIVKDCMESWKKYLSDFEWIKWDETNSPMEHPMVKKAVETKKYAFAADYTRMYALYEYGGVYLDTDMEIIKSLEPLLEKDGFLAYEDTKKDGSGKNINAAIVGITPKHPLIKKMLDIFDDRMKNNENFRPIPGLVVQAVKSLSEEELKGVAIYMPEYFYPYNPYDKQQERKQLMFADITENTYAIHHWEATWFKKEPSWWVFTRDKIRRKLGIIK